MEDKIFDIAIIGGGPAGLSAAIYAARRSMKTMVITSDIGGQISKTTEVENYPGFDKISGINLAMNFFNQAKRFGANFRHGKIGQRAFGKNRQIAFSFKTGGNY